MHGVVKKWIADRGFGFITTDTGDVFVHYRALHGMDDLTAGMPVEFDKVPGRDPGKWQAANVRQADGDPVQHRQLAGTQSADPQPVSENELRAWIEEVGLSGSAQAYDRFCAFARDQGWLSG